MGFHFGTAVALPVWEHYGLPFQYRCATSSMGALWASVFGTTVHFQYGSTMGFHFWCCCALPFGNIIGFHFGTSVRFHLGSTMGFHFGTTVYFQYGSTMGFHFGTAVALPVWEHYGLLFLVPLCTSSMGALWASIFGAAVHFHLGTLSASILVPVCASI